MIRERIPVDVVAKGDVKSNQRRSPPASPSMVTATWTPCPIVVVVNPAAIVIRRPAPRFITYPGPTVRRTPGPITITIRRPIVVVIDNCDVRPPDPAVIADIDPVSIGVEFLSAPHIFIVVLRVIT